MWISNRCSKWCYKSRCSITNIERGRCSNAIMLRKWSSNYDRSGIRANSLFVSIWFSETGVVWLFSHTNGWRQRLRYTLSINRSKSLSINWCGQFGFLFTIGKLKYITSIFRSPSFYLSFFSFTLNHCKIAISQDLYYLQIDLVWLSMDWFHLPRQHTERYACNASLTEFNRIMCSYREYMYVFDWDYINVANDLPVIQWKINIEKNDCIEEL